MKESTIVTHRRIHIPEFPHWFYSDQYEYTHYNNIVYHRDRQTHEIYTLTGLTKNIGRLDNPDDLPLLLMENIL